MVKLVSLSEKAYSRLKALKGKKSFSETVLDLVEGDKVKRGRSLLEFAGAWKDDKEMDKIFTDILRRRHTYKRRPVRL
jgi:predicted CopG family antitoxin